MPEPMSRRPSPYEADRGPAASEPETTRRAARPAIDDPLEELARILGESGAYPARPEPAAEVGRRANPARPLPQQLSALEADLFDELRASVTPDNRVRGEFAREITPPIPQHPADDHDIASLRIAPTLNASEAPRSAEGTHAQWSDFYAYDDGVSAGSYDPAFAQSAPAAAVPPSAAAAAARGVAPAYPHATFDEFGRDEIAAAAQEAAPMVAAEPRIMPHSREEVRAAARLPHDRPGGGMKIAVTAIAIVVLGGGALAAWKMTGGSSSGEPVLVHADGKPLKTLPDPSKAPVADAGPTLTPDDPKNASRIVSKQEEPVDQVSARTPEGKEVRLINPGAQRPAGDTPHTVKTVVVRPDGSIVSDGTTVRAAKGAAPVAAPADPVPAQAVTPPAAPAPAAAPTPPAASAEPPAPKPTAATQAPATTVKTVAVTPVTAPKPTAAKPATMQTSSAPAAPMNLGAVPPKLASQPPATPPAAPIAAKPAPAAPVAAKPAPAAPVAITPSSSGGGDFMVQISASGSENEARNSFSAAQRKYSALSGRSVDIQRADLGSKGVFYRARVSGGSRDQAAALCQQLKSQGGDCMVVKR